VNNADTTATKCNGGNKQTLVTLQSGYNGLVAAVSGAAVASVFSILF